MNFDGIICLKQILWVIKKIRSRVVCFKRFFFLKVSRFQAKLTRIIVLTYKIDFSCAKDSAQLLPTSYIRRRWAHPEEGRVVVHQHKQNTTPHLQVERGREGGRKREEEEDEAASEQVQEDVRLLRQQPGQQDELPRRRHRPRQRAGGRGHGPGLRRRQHRPHGARLPGRLPRRQARHWGDSQDSHDPRDRGGDGGGGEAGGRHAPAQGRDGQALRRLHSPAWRIRDAGGAAGGDHLGAAGHPSQAGWPAERGGVLRLPAHLHRPGRRGRLHQPRRPPHHRLRPHRPRAHGQARGVRALLRHGGVWAGLGGGSPGLLIEQTFDIAFGVIKK